MTRLPDEFFYLLWEGPLPQLQVFLLLTVAVCFLLIFSIQQIKILNSQIFEKCLF